MSLTSTRLTDILGELATRPGHEKVRWLVSELLVSELGVDSAEIDFERPLPEVRGRADALLGRTIFEFKRDLRRERRDAIEELTRYLSDRQTQTNENFIGIATDGATFEVYELRDEELRSLGQHTTDPEHLRALVAWLESTVAVSASLDPEPELVRRHLGKEGIAWRVASAELRTLWGEVGENPDVSLKRDLWAQRLMLVYSAPVGDDELFLQHTYLSIIAKTVATQVLIGEVPHPAELLAGIPFQRAGLTGVVESDLFDWPLHATGGDEVVRAIALEAARFRLSDVQVDVLKGLYESLIDAEQRHDLGEYYTPDWLAARMCDEAIERPLAQRVLDPSCGSGTFLFHAIRGLLDAADDDDMPPDEALKLCTQQVIGIDVHPLAVQIARVTYLLAIGEDRLRSHPALGIPVYLGDSLQWNTREFLADREVLIDVPGEGPLLEFPFAITRRPDVFDSVIDQMIRFSEADASSSAMRTALSRRRNPSIRRPTVSRLVSTFEQLRRLQREGRDHIWGWVARNLIRPVWLSQVDQRADVIIGNPPWLAYNMMAPEIQTRFRSESQRSGVWVWGPRDHTPSRSLCVLLRALCRALSETRGCDRFPAAIRRAQPPTVRVLSNWPVRSEEQWADR